MIRTIGFLAGVFLTVATFLLLLDIPGKSSDAPTAIVAQADVIPAGKESDEAAPPDHESGVADGDPGKGFVESTPGGPPAEPSEVSTDLAARAHFAQEGNTSDPVLAPDHQSGTSDGGSQSGSDASEPDETHRLEIQQQVAADDSDREHSDDANTYLFWSPFRSAWAARGFAGHLSSATQVPVEVVHTGPGKYRVAFSYQDETQRLARIRHIETITGLELE